MIIVTGTKRSGTSMWMQILRAAGFPTLGEAFPRDWSRTIRKANPEGFFESPLRTGIYYATNPNPRTGLYLFPQSTRRTAVKVFVPGLVRSDMAFVDKVIATMRSPREYVHSLERLYAMERENKTRLAHEKGREPLPFLEYMPPALEWWNDNYRLLCDALVRRYPLHMVSYETVLERPDESVRETLAWLGGGDTPRAISEVRAHMRTQRAETLSTDAIDLPADIARLCDELYARVHEQKPLDGPFIDRLNAAHDVLEPRIRTAEQKAKESRMHVRAHRDARKRTAKR
jgi:hypothetical protein